MADGKEKGADREEDERKIPVFTVMKNGAILKNIFVINQPRSPSSLFLGSNLESISSAKNEDKTNQEMEETLIVGRHPDCNIMLTHPSISRFHLQIHSKPSSQKLSVIDLSSVHGTWVSEKRIEPGVQVELKEADTIRVGGSTRVYKLHWIPLSRAYDMENPFISKMDLSRGKEGEEENPAVVAEIAAETNQIVQEENSVPNESENFQSLDLIFEDTDYLFADENSEITLKKEIPSAPLMPKRDSVLDEIGDVSPTSNDYKSGEISSPCKQAAVDALEAQNQQFDMNNQSSVEPVPELVYEKESLSDRVNKDADLLTGLVSSEPDKEVATKATENESPTQECNEHTRGDSSPLSMLLVTESVNSSSPEEEFLLEVATKATENESLTQECNEHTRGDSSPLSMLLATESVNSSSPEEEFLLEVATKATENESLTQECNEHTRGDSSPLSMLLVTESVNSSSPEEEFLLEVKTTQLSKENQMQGQRFALEQPSESEKDGNFGINENLNFLGSIKNARKLEEVVKNQRSSSKGQRKIRTRCSAPPAAESVSSSFPAGEVPAATENKESQTPQSRATAAALSEIENLEGSTLGSEKRSSKHCIWSRRGKPAAVLQIQTSRSKGKTRGGNDGEVEFQKQEGLVKGIASEALFSSLEVEEEIYTPDKENLTPRTRQLKFLKEIGKLEEIKPSPKATRPVSPKAAFSPGIQLEEDMNASSEQKNQTPLKFLEDNKKPEENKHSTGAYKPLSSKAAFSPSIQLEEGVNISSERENKTPLKFSKKKGRLEEIKHSPKMRQPFSSKASFNPSIQVEEEINIFSDKENQTPKLLCEQKPAKYSSRKPVLEQEAVIMKKRIEKMPFQSLLLDSSGKHVIAAPSYSSNSVNSSQPMEKRKNYVREAKRSWTIVVDTTTLMDKESRKSLKLLQGLRGTELVVPRMVIRELDCLKQRGSLFRRTTEVSAIFEWVEECMVKTKWWIHVQKSLEDVRPIAPTPPASPQSQFSGGGSSGWTTSSGPFSAHGMTEIVSPTAEDHILDCALLYRTMKSDGQLVLLSNNITLKIKAMAEGLICETAQEFRESLVNPFSERFLWAESSPRGLTWSHLDDIVLREKYSRYPAKKSSKGEGAKGLKLILLHNSHYGHI